MNCLTCTNFANCKILNEHKDENGSIPIQMVEVYGNECSNYFNPGK